MARDERGPAPAPAPQGRPRRSKYAVEKNLQGSLESTARGLEQLLESLQGSGFAEGLTSYRTLQAVLVQQKLWALSNHRTTVVAKFRPIARTAEKLHRIFAGYASVMDTLRKLEELTEANAPPLADEPELELGSGPAEATPEAPAAAPARRVERRAAPRGR